MTPAAIVITVVAAIVAATVVLIIRGVMSAQDAANEAKRLRDERHGRGPVPGLVIRPLAREDKPAWQKLWLAYCDFYEQDIPQPVTDANWERIHDPKSAIRGFGAYDAAGALLGIAHVILHPHTWSTKTLCYLEDLFVAPAVRGRDVGHALIGFLWKLAQTEHWGRLYWHTATNNTAARRLYDRFKPADAVVRYSIDVE